MRESFESDGNGKGRQMVNTARSGSFSWSDAQCSASVSSGRVYFEAKWTRGEVAIGLGIGFTGVGHDVTLALSRGRYALSVLISSDGYLSIIYAGHKSPVEGPPLPSGGTLGLALDATAGALFLVTSLGSPRLNGGQHTLRQLERRAPLRQRGIVKRSNAPTGYDDASFYDEDEHPQLQDQSEPSSPQHADGTEGRCVIALPRELFLAELFPTVTLRTGSTAKPGENAFAEIADGHALDAEVSIRFGAPVCVKGLLARGFRPLSLALAASARAFPALLSGGALPLGESVDPVRLRARAPHVPHVPAAARDIPPGGRARRGRERRAPLRQAARRRRRVARHLCVLHLARQSFAPRIYLKFYPLPFFSVSSAFFSFYD